jgi:NAD(P)-dependent dehydrogenase (short-subunit alcohol dehydrogenase family)
MREFQGKGAFITGGASGVGFALARAFGRAKMRVMLADIEIGALKSALAELKREDGSASRRGR